MASNDPPILRRWDGKTKTASAWSINVPEPDLCPTVANCSIYLSDVHDHDHAQQPTASLKVTFDQLVVKQCQPLLKNLVLDFSNSDSSISACHVDRRKRDRASWDVPLSSWTCSLTLPPPKLASEHDALQYNVTTRNFFAWIIDAPIVGFNPTAAMVALKTRMDIWRAPSCDNVATLQEYARSQSYGYLAGLHLVNTTILRSTPFVPSDYTLTSALVSHNPPASDLNRPQQFGLSLRKRAGSILKRKHEGEKAQGAFSSRPSSAPVQSSVPDAELNGLTFMSGALPHNSGPPQLAITQSMIDDSSWLGSAYDAISDNGKSSDSSTATDKSSGLTTLSSRTTTTDSRPDLPELDATYATKSKDFAQPSSWLPDLRQGRPQATTGSLYQSPTSIDPPRSYSNAANRHSFSGDRRRPQSRSRPPSPIMEEVMEPVRKKQANATAASNSTLKRFSLPPMMTGRKSEPGRITPAASMTNSQRPSQDEDRSFHPPTLPRASTDSTMTICANCNRCKKPCSPTVDAQPKSPTTSVIHPGPQINSSTTSVDGPAQPKRSPTPVDTSNLPFLSEGRWLSAKSRSKDPLREGEVTRFPSLRRRGRSSTVPSAPVPELPQDAGARIATHTGRLRSSSQAAPTTRSVISETASPIANPRRSLDQAPLSEQRYSPPTHTGTSTEQRYLPRTQSYNLTEPDRNSPVQMSRPVGLRSPIQMTPSTERRTSRESAQRQALQLRLSTPAATEERTKISLDLPSFPEPMPSVIMKSNGRRISLALPHDENTSLSINHPFFTEQAIENLPASKDDQIVFEQLLDGLQFIDKDPQDTAPRAYSKPPPKKEIGVTTGFPRASSKPTQTRAPKSPKTPKSPVAKLRRFTWTGSIRGWLSKEKSYNDAGYDSVPRPMSKGAECQVRVLTLDAHGHFSTSMIDTPGEGTVDWR